MYSLRPQRRFALGHYDVLKNQARAIVAGRDELARSLDRIPGVTHFPSQANFVLIRVPDAKRAFDGLLSRGILIKDVSQSHPLLENCLRITVRDSRGKRRLRRSPCSLYLSLIQPLPVSPCALHKSLAIPRRRRSL